MWNRHEARLSCAVKSGLVATKSGLTDEHSCEIAVRATTHVVLPSLNATGEFGLAMIV